MLIRKCLIFVTPILLAGCGSVLPAPKYMPVLQPINQSQPFLATVNQEVTLQDPSYSSWWEQANDPILQSLLEQLLARNLSIELAKSNIRQAELGLLTSKSFNLPSISGSSGSQRSQEIGEDEIDFFSLGIDAFWDPDLFGRRSSTIAAGEANIASAKYTLGEVRIALVAELSQSYFSLRILQEQIQIAEKRIKFQEENWKISSWRNQAGLSSIIDTKRAFSQLQSTKASISLLRLQVEQTINRIAVLTAQRSSDIFDELNKPLVAPDIYVSFIVNMPADILRQRPDVLAAEQNFVSAVQAIGIARADFYPDLSLTGNIGTSALELSMLFESITTQLSANLLQNLFDNKLTKSNFKLSKENAEASYIVYQDTILSAFEEVENAISLLNHTRETLRQLELSVLAAQEVAELSIELYATGSIDFLDVLTSESSLLELQDQIVSIKGQIFEAIILLYLATGGGWETYGYE